MENKRQDGSECLASLHVNNFPPVAQIKIYWTDTVEMGKKAKKETQRERVLRSKAADDPFEGTFGKNFRVPGFCIGY